MFNIFCDYDYYSYFCVWFLHEEEEYPTPIGRIPY